MPVETVLYTTLRGDDEPVEEIPAEIIRYGYRLNRPGSLSFSLALDHEFCTRDIIGPGTHEAVVVRNREIVWRGPVWTAQETDTEGDRKVEFGAEGLLSYTRQMFWSQDKTFSSVDQFTIARQTIDHHQDKAGGNVGIDTSGADTSGVTRDKTYHRGKNIGKSLVELAERIDGFDFAINPDTRLLELHYPRQGTRQDDLIWEDGIRDYSRSIDSTEQASQVLGVGEGEGDDQVKISRQDSGAVAEFGLSQRVFSDMEISEEDTLDGHVRRELAYHLKPVQILKVTIGTDQFNPFAQELGVEGRLKYESSYDVVNEVRRMIGFDIVWEQGDERVELDLAPVVNL